MVWQLLRSISASSAAYSVKSKESRFVSLSAFAESRRPFLTEQLIDFGDSDRPVMDCIGKLSTRQFVHRRTWSLFFFNKPLTALFELGISCYGYLTRCRRPGRCCHFFKKTKKQYFFESVSLLKPWSNGTCIEAATRRWCDDYSKRVIVSSLNYVKIACLVVSRALEGAAHVISRPFSLS